MTLNIENHKNIFRVLWLAVLLYVSTIITLAQAADQKYWELSPYRVQILLSIDLTQQPQSGLSEQLAAELQRSIRSTLYPLWKTEIQLNEAAQKHRQLRFFSQLENFTEQETAGCDKRIFVNIVANSLGYSLESREFDCTTLRWSSVQQLQVRQAWMLQSQCFQLICQTFSPLATIRTIPDKEDEIILHFRGSDLPKQADLDFLIPAGEVYQPLMVRTNSAGELKTDSIREVPWTYLSLGERHDDGWHGHIHTGTRRPFGVRRRGRVEHLALAMKNPTGSTDVRFYARHDKTQGLSGYEVFQRDPGEEKTQALGLTNIQGVVEVEKGNSKVTLLFLRSEGQLLAKVPVVPGARLSVEVPVADDTARLRAQASLTSLTERLIDTVAQRNILIARVRASIKSGDLEQAQELFTVLDNLPGRAKFDQDIKSVENRSLNRSEDPKVQARIEKLFADARQLLGRFLNTRQITELQGELTAARRGESS